MGTKGATTVQKIHVPIFACDVESNLEGSRA